MPFVKGGKLKGGRPKGSFKKPRFSDYLTADDVSKLVQTAIKLALDGDSNMLKLTIEQHFGKPAQAMDVTSDGKPVQFLIPKEIGEKNDINSVAK